ncbi:MAG TPA: polysaccharide biosynthesis tyrosine autokinase [Methylomirabilota bacterium]|nr:polysaccharide biosynthesis tyrosine autokinase [Methylomirabilota bacterium]
MDEENKTMPGSPEMKLHFLDYWRIIRIRKTVILAVFLLVVITTTVVTYLLPQSFASTVRISVEKDTADVEGMGSDRVLGGFDPFWVETQFQKIQSKSILYPVITNLGLRRAWAEREKIDGELPIETTYLMLKRTSEVNQYRNTSVIEIKVFSEDRDEAARIANEIAKVYKESRIARQLDRLTKGISTLEAQLEEQNKRVVEKQAEVDFLKAKFGIHDMDTIMPLNAPTVEPDVLRKLEGLRVETQDKWKQIESLYTHLTNLSRAEFRKAAAIAHQDPQLDQLSIRLALAEEEYAKLGPIYAEEHPERRAVKRTIETLNQLIDDRLTGILTGLKAKVDSERLRLDDLNAEVEKYRKYEIERAIERRPYFLAKRDLENLQMTRDKLLNKIMQEKVDSVLPRSGIVEVIDPAEPSLRPVRPRKVLNIALGVIVGLVVGVGLAFFIEYLDTSVKTIDDVERALQAPVLGVIPQNVGYLIYEGPDSPHAEAYRVLRTNILFSQKDPSLNTITIVSAGAGEGKSTTSFNLATVFAQNGARVIIVDSDLRRPSLHKILKVSNAIGLTNYLLKQNTLEEVIQTTPVPTLDFMPSGKLPSSSMGVLSSSQMKELIRDLKRRYDYVFFDSPPIMGVSDASILASEVDMVLHVIQYRRYPQPMTIRAKQMIEKVGGNLIGIVLNNINMASDENYYYYSGQPDSAKDEEEDYEAINEAAKSGAKEKA